MLDARDEIFCEICDGESFWGIEKFNQHALGLKHLSKLPLYITVKVRSLNYQQIESIHQYFEKFGVIIKHEERIEGGYAFIDYYFEDPKVYTGILLENHKLFGTELEISYSKKLTTLLGGGKDSRASILESVKKGKTFSQQLEILQSSLQMDNEAQVQENMKIIHADLTELLSSSFPLHQVHFIGSTVTGLNFKRGCLDIYLANVKTYNDPKDLTFKTLKQLVIESTKFYPCSTHKGFATVIVRCIHTRTQTHCILNIGDKLSVANSKLINYYLTLDDKIRPLMIIIKFWSKCQKLKQKGSLLFTGYAVCLLVIFFLQQEPYKLPSVYELQKDCAPDIKDGWNCAYSTPKNEFPALHNESLLNIVAGFFRFYSSFDYMTQVVCPYLGAAVTKTAFLKPYELPDSYQRYMAQNETLPFKSALCVQDPFEHHRNVFSVSLEFAGRFALLCAMAEQCTAKTDGEFLYTILIECERPLMKEISFTIKKEGDSKSEQEWFTSLKNFTIKVLKEIIYCQINELANLDSVQVLDCVYRPKIWVDRVNIMKTLRTQLPPETNDFDLELAIVPHILKYCPYIFNQGCNSVAQFSLVATMREHPCRVEFVMRLKNPCTTYSHVANYFRLKFPYWLKIAENSENLQSDENVEGNWKAEEIKQESATDVKLTEINGDGEMNDKLNGENSNCSDSSPNRQFEKLLSGPQLQPEESQANDDFVVDPKTNEIPAENKPKPIEDGEIVDEESEEEDIPADFFDDFANEDFMDGLDIANVWSDEPEKCPEDDNSEGLSSEKRIHSPISSSSKESHWKSSEKREKRAHDACRSKSRSPIKRRKTSSKRRDLKKAKRSINTEKIKCGKDKELKVVGLVPTGTEMDVDIASTMNKGRFSEESQKTPKASLECKSKSMRTGSGCRRKHRLSIDTDASERELAIRSKRKRSRSRSRDPPSNPKSKKKTFIEEIRDKVNEILPVLRYNYSKNAAISHPTPRSQPVVAYPISLKEAQNFNDVLSNTTGNIVALAQVRTNPVSLSKLPVVQPKLSVSKESSVNPVKQTDDAEKLFADKKISLSDFLTITAKPAVRSASQEYIQRKIKVISRCQHAIKAMSDDDLLRRLRPMKSSSEVKNEPLMKHQSPLRKSTSVRFEFNSLPKVPEADSYAAALDKILENVGVLKEVAEISVKKAIHSSFAGEDTELISQAIADVRSCGECRRRELKVFSDVGVQVCDEELNATNELEMKRESNMHGFTYHPYFQFYGTSPMGEGSEYVQTAPTLGGWDFRGSPWDCQYNNGFSSPYADLNQAYWGTYLNTIGSRMTTHYALPCPDALPSTESLNFMLKVVTPSLPPGVPSASVRSIHRNSLMVPSEIITTNPPFSQVVISEAVTSESNVTPNGIITSDAVTSKAVPSGIVTSDLTPSQIVPTDSITKKVVTSDATPSDVGTSDVASSDIVNSDVITGVAVTSDIVTSDVVISDTNKVITSEPVTSDAAFCKLATSDVDPSLVVYSKVVTSNIVTSDLPPTQIVPNDSITKEVVTSDAVPSDVDTSDVASVDIVNSEVLTGDAVASEVVTNNIVPSGVDSIDVAASIIVTSDVVISDTNKVITSETVTSDAAYCKLATSDVDPSGTTKSEVVVYSKVCSSDIVTSDSITKKVVTSDAAPSDIDTSDVASGNIVNSEVITCDAVTTVIGSRDVTSSDIVTSDVVINNTHKVIISEPITSNVDPSGATTSEVVTSKVVTSDVVTSDVAPSDIGTNEVVASDATPNEVVTSDKTSCEVVTSCHE